MIDFLVLNLNSTHRYVYISIK